MRRNFWKKNKPAYEARKNDRTSYTGKRFYFVNEISFTQPQSEPLETLPSF